MNNPDFFQYKLPARIYRRFLILTDACEGSRAAPGSLLIKVHSGGEGIPFFWCGTPDTWPSFCEQLGRDRSMYCLCGTYGVLPPTNENILALSKYYAAEIIKIQPNGPYLLGGFCEAGLISLEIANIMQAHGYQVGMLVLFDVDVRPPDFWLSLALKLFKAGENVRERRDQFAEHPVQCIKEILANKWHQLVELPIRYIIDVINKCLKNSGVDEQPLAPLYELPPYPGKIDLIYVKWGVLGYYQFKFFQRYWNKLALGGTDFNIIAGNVHNMPNWSAVAKIVQEIIKKLGV